MTRGLTPFVGILETVLEIGWVGYNQFVWSALPILYRRYESVKTVVPRRMNEVLLCLCHRCFFNVDGVNMCFRASLRQHQRNQSATCADIEEFTIGRLTIGHQAPNNTPSVPTFMAHLLSSTKNCLKRKLIVLVFATSVFVVFQHAVNSQIDT